MLDVHDNDEGNDEHPKLNDVLISAIAQFVVTRVTFDVLVSRLQVFAVITIRLTQSTSAIILFVMKRIWTIINIISQQLHKYLSIISLLLIVLTQYSLMPFAFIASVCSGQFYKLKSGKTRDRLVIYLTSDGKLLATMHRFWSVYEQVKQKRASPGKIFRQKIILGNLIFQRFSYFLQHKLRQRWWKLQQISFWIKLYTFILWLKQQRTLRQVNWCMLVAGVERRENTKY